MFNFVLYLPHLWIAFRLVSQVPNDIFDLPLVKFHGAHLVLVTKELRLTELEEVSLEVFRPGVRKFKLTGDRHRRLYLHKGGIESETESGRRNAINFNEIISCFRNAARAASFSSPLESRNLIRIKFFPRPLYGLEPAIINLNREKL